MYCEAVRFYLRNVLEIEGLFFLQHYLKYHPEINDSPVTIVLGKDKHVLICVFLFIHPKKSTTPRAHHAYDGSSREIPY